MIQIANVSYRKIYKFPYLSDAMLLKILLYGLSLLLPFFMVYSVNNFYLSFVDNVTANPTITFDYSYHLTIQTSTSIYTYSTLQSVSTGKAISVSYQNNENERVHTFTVDWPKSVGEKVKKVSLALFMKYSTNSINNAYGMVYTEGIGYDLADLNAIGTLQIAKGQNSLADPPTSNILSTYKYNLGDAMLALEQNYKVYLKSQTQYLSNNMRNNLFKFSCTLKAPQVAFQVESASILGQLIWSFTQYFPIACVFILVSQLVLSFLLKENIIKRTIINDKIL